MKAAYYRVILNPHLLAHWSGKTQAGSEHTFFNKVFTTL